MAVKRLTRMALLTAVALTIFIVELQLPALVPVPGVKPGLANIITVYAVFTLGPAEAFCILLARILLGSMFAGQMMSLLYSLAGGMLCFLLMLALRRFLAAEQIWICSVFGAMAHNVGQISVAVLLTKTPSLLCYLPVLMPSRCIAGTLTGLCAQYVIHRMPPGSI